MAIMSKMSLRPLKICLFTLLCLPHFAFAADITGLTPAPPRVGVMIEKTLYHDHMLKTGSGVMLTDHLVLTAAHVISGDTNPHVTVIIDGWRVPGTVIASGQGRNVDLALVRIEPTPIVPKSLAHEPLPVCATDPPPNQPVVVLSMGATTRSNTLPITSNGATADGTSNLLGKPYHPGNSGGGVFNPLSGCLWGILNLELSGTVDGRTIDISAFVPASTVSRFLHDSAAH